MSPRDFPSAQILTSSHAVRYESYVNIVLDMSTTRYALHTLGIEADSPTDQQKRVY